MSLRKRKEECVCPLDDVLSVISKKWALLILNSIGNNEKIRFNRMMETLPGINSKTLSDRLKELEAFKLIERRAYAEIPPRVEYSLTGEGMKLRKAVMPLMKLTHLKTKTEEREKTPCDLAYQKVS
jgi:DNA-binding HxlR family transcriptional regulator